MSTSSFAEYLVEQLDALIYLVDLQTYEVLYINEMGKKLFGPGQVVGQPCYRVLQGRDAPCPFCNHRATDQGRLSRLGIYKSPHRAALSAQGQTG